MPDYSAFMMKANRCTRRLIPVLPTQEALGSASMNWGV